MQRKELTGMKFGRLTVIERGESTKTGKARWKCLCDCGKTKIIGTNNLRRGDSKSCGCLHKEIVSGSKSVKTGDKFGKLTAVEYQGRLKRGNSTYWLCKCDCGRQKRISRDKLVQGKTKSCGCSRRGGNQKEINGFPFICFSIIRSSALARKLDFDVSFEYLANLFKEQDGKCALSGENINFHDKVEYNRRTSSRSASLDRIDSSKGYVKGNVWWVHLTPNLMKGELSVQQFKDWCRKVDRNP